MIVGNLLDDAIDAGSDAIDEVGDAVTSAIDNVKDAGALIGGALKFASPMLAFYPGIGTALSVATYAAGAIAAGDSITDAAIGTASAAMPPGLPRLGFDSGVAISRDVAEGRNAFGSVVDACRGAAQQACGDRCRAAFDAALNAARGGRIDPRAIAQMRSLAANGGTAEVLAFDAGVAVANGESAPDVLLTVGRSYIAEAGGGPLALAAYDSGVALGYGQTLQEAGFTALHRFVKGTGAEKVLDFIEQIYQAERSGKDLKEALTELLGKELQNVAGYGDAAWKKIGPVLDRVRIDPALLDVGSEELGRAWNVAEPLVRAAQVILTQPTHEDGQELLDDLLRPPYEKEYFEAKASAVQRAQAAAPGVSLRTSVAGDASTQASALGGARPAAAPVLAKYVPTGVVRSAAPPPALVQSVAVTPKARTGVAGDVVLGGTIAAAGVALYWFFR